MIEALLTLLVSGALLQETAAPAPRPSPPKDVTEATRADEDALARLLAPGEVILRDDFESEDSWKLYFEARGRKSKRAVLIQDSEAAHSGSGALRLTAPDQEGKASGAGVTAWLGDEGHERVYFRRYLRFAEDYNQGMLNHTGGGLSGVAGTGKWDGMGSAGLKPTGDDRFSCRMEPWLAWGRWELPGAWALYTYWMDMKRDRDGNFWGNLLMPAKEQRTVSALGEWLCIEQMIQINTPGEADGELAAWVDGELYLHMTGIRWRSDERVTVKRMVLDVYIHKSTQDNTVWFDDVVVSTGYVGPIVEETAEEAAEAIEKDASPNR